MAAPKSEVDQQLAEYQKKMRMSQSNRKQFTEDSQNTIRKQKIAIEKMKRENEALREELAATNVKVSSKDTLELTKRINAASTEFSTLTRKLAEHRRRYEEVDRQVKILTAKIAELKSQRGGIHKAAENDDAVQRQIKLLENRLDKSLIKFNEALATNRALREEIDNLRTERQVFDDIYKKMERDLHEKKKQMAEVIEDSNIAYEERDQCQTELAALKLAFEKENADMDRQMRELDAELEKDRRRRAQLRMREGQSAASGPGEGGLDETLEGGASSMHADPRSPARGQWNEAVEMASHEVVREKVEEYEEAVRKIKEATGLDDLEIIVEKFVQAEEQNFSLFNFVNDLNNEIEKLDEQIAEMRGEIASIQGQGAQSSSQHEKIIADLETKLTSTEEKSVEYEAKHDDTLRVIDGLRSGIESLFSRIGCDLGPIAEILGDASVTESNMMQFLGIIEQRANELLQLYAALQGPELSAEFGSTSQSIIGAAVFGMGPSTPFGAVVLDVKPPAAGDDIDGDDSDGDDLKPLTREQLQERARLASERKPGKRTGGLAASPHSMSMRSPGLGGSAAASSSSAAVRARSRTPA